MLLKQQSVNIDNKIPIEEFSDAEIIETICPSQNNEVAEEVIATPISIHAAQIQNPESQIPN